MFKDICVDVYAGLDAMALVHGNVDFLAAVKDALILNEHIDDIANAVRDMFDVEGFTEAAQDAIYDAPLDTIMKFVRVDKEHIRFDDAVSVVLSPRPLIPYVIPIVIDLDKFLKVRLGVEWCRRANEAARDTFFKAIDGEED